MKASTLTLKYSGQWQYNHKSLNSGKIWQRNPDATHGAGHNETHIFICPSSLSLYTLSHMEVKEVRLHVINRVFMVGYRSGSTIPGLLLYEL